MSGVTLDEARLRPWLAATLGPSEDLHVTRHMAGHSNETFFLRWGGRSLVLRRPPEGAFLPTAHDVLREHRILAALEGTRARVPRAIAACEDPSVIGTPFYVMARVEGHVVRATLPDALGHSATRRRMGEELVDALAEIHSVPWKDTPLASLGKPEGYLERQVKRWTGQMEMTLPWTENKRAVPELREAGAWLASHVPASPPTTLVHGDYKLDNVVYDDAGRLVAVLDWEMSTLGDPLADLGWMLSFWRERGDPEPLPFEPRVTEAPGFLSRADLVARYEHATGVKAAHLPFYKALAAWKLAILLEGSFARHLLGATDDPFFAHMEEGVPALARRALAIAHGEGE